MQNKNVHRVPPGPGMPDKLRALLHESQKAPIVVVFLANWIGSGDMYMDFIGQAARDYGVSRIETIDVDVDEDMSSYLKVDKLPTTLYLYKHEIKDRFSGVLSTAKLAERFDVLLES